MGRVSIVDLSGGATAISRGLHERLSATSVLVPVADGSAARTLDAAGIAFRTYADAGLAPDAPSSSVVRVLSELAAHGPVALALAGYPLLRAGVVTGLLAGTGSVDVLGPGSPLEVLVMALDVDPTVDVDLLDVDAVSAGVPSRGSHLVITGVSSPIVARSVARHLARHYPADHPAVVAERLGDTCRLTPADVGDVAEAEVTWSDSTLYLPPHRASAPGGIAELVRIMAMLRAPDGCPWDREQTHETLRRHLIEEAYEAVAAIENGDDAELVDELGDVLLQVVFHAQIASEVGSFDLDDVAGAIAAKLRRRHPHIFGDATADTAAEVMHRWDRIKRDEKAGQGLLDGIAHTLPALTYAGKISRRAVSVGFEWETIDDVWDKVVEEIEELKACEAGTPEAEEEVGDLLFTVVNVARKMDVDPEQALRLMCEKFRRRFGEMERGAAEEGRDLSEMGIDEMEALWRRAKEGER